MKKRFTEEQIIGILKEAEAGPRMPILHQSRAIKSSSFNANIRLLASSFLVLE